MAGLVPFEGQPVHVEFRDSIRVSRGKITASAQALEVHAASFLPQRLIILERSLLEDPTELRRILVHELFHFVWRRLGNTRRREWDQLLVAESIAHARGDLGWSAQWRKEKLSAGDRIDRSRLWRDYVCEAFCDTAAWMFALAPSDEHTLARSFCFKRRCWFFNILASGGLSI